VSDDDARVSHGRPLRAAQVSCVRPFHEARDAMAALGALAFQH
jgi:hypothetical protein